MRALIVTAFAVCGCICCTKKESSSETVESGKAGALERSVAAPPSAGDGQMIKTKRVQEIEPYMKTAVDGSWTREQWRQKCGEPFQVREGLNAGVEFLEYMEEGPVPLVNAVVAIGVTVKLEDGHTVECEIHTIKPGPSAGYGGR